MDWNKASSIAEVLSSIAILVTLFYLAVEIQQGAEATQAQTRQDIMASDQQLLELYINNPNLGRAWWQTEDLTDDEKIRLSYTLISLVRMRESNWFQFRNGTLDAEAWDSYRMTLIVVLSATHTRRWWENYGVERQFNTDFISSINELLVETPIIADSPHLMAFE